MAKRNKRTVAVDFDGVIHKYIHGDWREGEIYGDIFSGAIEGLVKLLAWGFNVVIFTTRAGDEGQRQKIRQWLYDRACSKGIQQGLFAKWLETGDELDFPFLVTNEKVQAIAYVDDRAIRHISWPDTLRYFG